MSAELLPCPFCGSEDTEVSYYTRATIPEPAGYFVGCSSCSANGESFEIQDEAPDRVDYTKSKAIAAWNTRAAAPSLAARIRVLEDALRWYGEQARLARLIHSEGDAGRHALSEDGGKRARAALHPATQASGECCMTEKREPDANENPYRRKGSGVSEREELEFLRAYKARREAEDAERYQGFKRACEYERNERQAPPA